jgi:hypothetical protein
MKQMSTGFGLAVLGACVLGAAFIASPRFGQQAFAQVTGDRRIVSASVFQGKEGALIAFRIWSDNAIEVRNLGGPNTHVNADETGWGAPLAAATGVWKILDNGLTTFVPADVDASGTVDPADLGGVLIEMGNTQAGNPPPPIDCTINAPR